MLEDQLLLGASFKYHRILVKAFYPPGQLDAAHKIYRHIAPFLSGAIEKTVLYSVLLCVFFHVNHSPPRAKSLIRVIETNTNN